MVVLILASFPSSTRRTTWPSSLEITTLPLSLLELSSVTLILSFAGFGYIAKSASKFTSLIPVVITKEFILIVAVVCTVGPNGEVNVCFSYITFTKGYFLVEE